MLIPASATASQLMPSTMITSQAVIANMPPIVLFALQRFKSPLVLKMSDMFKEDSRLATIGFIRDLLHV